MKDRAPLYPGRVTLTPVPGQPNTYDLVRADQPTQVGTPLSKASLLKDSTAAKLGGDSDMLPTEALEALLTRINAGLQLLWSRETAGSGTWVAPDLNNGQPYKIRVVILSGGGSGAAGAIVGHASSDYSVTCSGGGSGDVKSFEITVAPFSTHSWVCGPGGTPVVASWRGSSNYTTKDGNAGGSTSFDGNAVIGGNGGKAANGINQIPDGAGANGGIASDGYTTYTARAISKIGSTPPPIVSFTGAYGVSSATAGDISLAATCLGDLNVFNGGFSYIRVREDVVSNGKQANNPTTNSGAPAVGGATVTATRGLYPSCGGGAASAGVKFASANPGATATSGAGASGAIYICVGGFEP